MLANRGILLEQIHEALVASRRSELSALVAQQTNFTVQSGPFKNMRIRPEISWGDGDIGQKLLGVYEQELQPVIEYFASKQYGAIVNIGCAEGYYAVGLSFLFPSTPVLAFDSNAASQKVCQLTAEQNGKDGQVTVKGLCTTNDLTALATQYGSLLCVVDCEGYETELFDHEGVASFLHSSDFVIECHDCAKPGITESLTKVFESTHRVLNVKSGSRNPNDIPMLTALKDSDRWLMMSERRPCVMNWLVCEARAGSKCSH